MSTARQALLQFLAERDIFAHLASYLDTVPKTATVELREHTRQIRQALRAATVDSNATFKVNTIDDTFFSDRAGNSVQNADYAFVEILGPTGACRNDEIRLGLSYQGPGLQYHGHHHVAQELYFVLQGTSGWWTDTAPRWEDRSCSWHLTNEHHAMRTGDSPALYFWSWTGESLALEIGLSAAELQAKL